MPFRFPYAVDPAMLLNVQGQFSDIVRQQPVLHWWTLVEPQHRLAASAQGSMAPRIGAVSLPADLPVSWVALGNYRVPTFSKTVGSGKFIGQIPNPGNIFSVLEVSRPIAAGLTANSTSDSWGLQYADLEFDSAPYSNRIGSATFRFNNSQDSIPGPAQPPLDSLVTKATVIDFTNKVIAQAINGGAFTVVTAANPTVSQYLVPKPDPMITINIGRAGPNNSMHGQVCDLLLLSGDVRQRGTFWAQWNAYKSNYA